MKLNKTIISLTMSAMLGIFTPSIGLAEEQVEQNANLKLQSNLEKKKEAGKTKAETIKELKELEELRVKTFENLSKESIDAYKSAHAKITCFPESCPYELRGGPIEFNPIVERFNKELSDLEFMIIRYPTTENISAYKKKKEEISTRYYGAIQDKAISNPLKDLLAKHPYSAMMALKTMCPNCEDIMAWLEGVQRDLSNFFREENKRNYEISNATARE